MTEKHPWDDLDTDLPQPGATGHEHDEGNPSPGDDAADNLPLPDGDAELDEDMS